MIGHVCSVLYRFLIVLTYRVVYIVMPGYWPCLQRTLKVSYCIDLSSCLGIGPCLQRTLQVSYCIDLSSSIYRHAWLLAMFAAYFTGFLLY